VRENFATVLETVADVVAHVAQRLADYKKPRVIVFVPRVRRSPSGRADLRWARAVAAGDAGTAGPAASLP
jgi:3-oxocholest-4-en-26-oate---CoA ligase